MRHQPKFKAALSTFVFTVLALVLNFYGPKIPAPYMPSLLYYLWEVPIVAAFVLCGAKAGIFTALLSVLVPFAFSKENFMPNPLYCLAATLGMLLGIGVAKFYALKHSPNSKIALAAISTVLGAVFRTIVAALVFLAFLGFSPSLGFGFPETAKTITIINRVVYDFSLALYTIPLGYFFAYCLKLSADALG
jgi:riboflavin transporter FmnP